MDFDLRLAFNDRHFIYSVTELAEFYLDLLYACGVFPIKSLIIMCWFEEIMPEF